MKQNLIVAAIALLVWFCVGMNTPANAVDSTSVHIKNPGFENPVVKGEDDYIFQTPPGWTTYDPNNLIPAQRTRLTASTGVGNPAPNNFYFEEAPEGQNVGFVFLPLPLGSGSAGLEQKLDTVLKPNTKYTLTVDVGNFGGTFEGISLDGFPGYRVELLAGGTVLAADHNLNSIKDREFKTSTVTYTATPDNPYLGQKLKIRLINLLEGSFPGLDFDNVRLTAQSV